VVRRQRWCDLQLLVDDLVERDVLRYPNSQPDDDYWG
jgi:hypothetical protein